MVPTLDGNPVFGVAVKIRHQPTANAAQISAFFGVQGSQYLGGGSRGRTFFCEGVFVEQYPANLELDGLNLASYADGFPHILVDVWGNSWFNIVYNNEYEWSGLARPTLGGSAWCRPYKAVLSGLT